mmetsp:Transcript_2633/g.4799  ORF Transcript_2633/g.4799 Transcript_2633/m.4799 type:complete len:191 (+) Transcript_2633:131-703(+)
MIFNRLFDGLICCQATCAGCFLLSALFLASNSYAGSVAVLTGLVALAHTGGAWYCIRQRVSRTLYGAVLGSSCVVTFVYLESAIFWGQYSSCEKYHHNDSISNNSYGVACSDTPAMTSLCTFSVFLFLLSIALAGTLLQHKDDLLGSDPLDEDLAAHLPSLGRPAWAEGRSDVRGGAGGAPSRLSFSTDL